MRGTTANPQAMALPWEWIFEKLVDNKEIGTPLLKSMISNVPDVNSTSSRSLQERIALRYLEEILFVGKIEAQAVALVKIFASSSSDSQRVEDLLLRICTEVVLGHLREADGNGERNWKGFEDDLNRLFAEGAPPPFISRRNELMGLLKDKSAYVSILENYPVEVLKTDLLHFVRDKKARQDKAVLDQLVCDIHNGRHYTCASTLNDKHASPTRQECISGGGRKRVYRKDTFEYENRGSGGDKRLKHGGSDASPSNSYDSFQREQYLSIQTDNLNNDIQKTTAHGSSDKERERRQEVNCNIGEEILPDGQYGENADNEVHGVGRQMSDFGDNSDDKKGRMEGRVAEELPALDHLLVGNDCSRHICLKCRKGGALSYCDGCGFAAHDKCLQSYVSIVSGGDVSCPACSYKRALADFNKVKKQALEFKDKLLAFIHDAVQGNVQKSPDRSSSEIEIFPDAENTSKDPSNHLTASDLGSKKNELPLCIRSCETSVHENEIPIGNGNGHPFGEYAYNGQHDDDHEATIAEERKYRLRPRKSPVVKNGYDGGHNGDHEAGDAENRKYTLRHKKLQMRGSFRLPGVVRRNPLPWTKEEEKILKEGMQKFAPLETHGIPWKRILEHGRGVFNKFRLPIDLKDKWRNMKKTSS